MEKKKKTTLVDQHSQTIESGPSHAVSELDLTSSEGPSEKYWESLAETRRRALEDSLRENEGLHGRVRSLEEELNVTNEMLDEARNLVEILKEMLVENEGEAAEGANPAEEADQSSATTPGGAVFTALLRHYSRQTTLNYSSPPKSSLGAVLLGSSWE